MSRNVKFWVSLPSGEEVSETFSTDNFLSEWSDDWTAFHRKRVIIDRAYEDWLDTILSGGWGYEKAEGARDD